jgi:hypothetical protein
MTAKKRAPRAQRTHPDAGAVSQDTTVATVDHDDGSEVGPERDPREPLMPPIDQWRPAQPDDTPGQAQPDQGQQPDPPTALVEGYVAIYETPDGGMVLAMNILGGSDVASGRLALGVHRMKVPAGIVRMIMAFAKGDKGGSRLGNLIYGRMRG